MKHAFRTLIALAIVSIAVAPAWSQVTVETFTANYTFDVSLPGTPSGPDIVFNGSMVISTLDFTPGSVTFQGQPVDFDGTEADWLVASYSGTAAVPNSPSSAVNTSGSGSITGSAGNMSGTTEHLSLDLGASFAESFFDVFLSSGYDGRDHVLSWSSPVVPELNGASVDVETSNTITGVDPANGIVNVSGNGTIKATPNIPTLSDWGLILLVVGLMGLAAMMLARRRAMPTAA